MTEETTEIRAMRPEDCEETAELLSACFTHPWTEDSLRAMFLSGDYVSLVARCGREIGGYIGMKTVLDEADITNVAVCPARRGCGIATRLLGDLLAQARVQGITHIYLEVRRSNQAAIALYAHAGFVRTGLRKNYYEAPREDALLMALDLSGEKGTD